MPKLYQFTELEEMVLSKLLNIDKFKDDSNLNHLRNRIISSKYLKEIQDTKERQHIKYILKRYYKIVKESKVNDVIDEEERKELIESNMLQLVSGKSIIAYYISTNWCPSKVNNYEFRYRGKIWTPYLLKRIMEDRVNMRVYDIHGSKELYNGFLIQKRQLYLEARKIAIYLRYIHDNIKSVDIYVKSSLNKNYIITKVEDFDMSYNQIEHIADKIIRHIDNGRRLLNINLEIVNQNNESYFGEEAEIVAAMLCDYFCFCVPNIRMRYINRGVKFL